MHQVRCPSAAPASRALCQRSLRRLARQSDAPCCLPRRCAASNGLTFKRWEKKGEILVVNSSELRAVQGRQANDFVLHPINPPKLREKHGRAKKGAVVREVAYALNQKWHLDSEVDRDTREVCEGT